MRAQEIAARDYPDDASRMLAAHNRESAYPFQDHVIGGVAKRVVLEDHRRLARDYVAKQLLSGARAVHQIAPRDDAD